MALLLGTIFAGLVVVIALWLAFRFYIIPPLEADAHAVGLQIKARRGDLRNVSISVDGRPWVDLGDVSNSSVVTWSMLGFNGTTPAVQNVTLLGRAGSRWFESHITFGSTAQVEYASQTWRYIDPAQAEQMKSLGQSQLTAAPESP